MKQGMASKERSNVRPNLSCWLWLVGILLVLHLLIMEARGAHSAEPLTRIAFGSCANQSAPQVIFLSLPCAILKNSSISFLVTLVFIHQSVISRRKAAIVTLQGNSYNERP